MRVSVFGLLVLARGKRPHAGRGPQVLAGPRGGAPHRLQPKAALGISSAVFPSPHRLPGCPITPTTSTTPYARAADVDEERRLLYVGITRAKQRLVLTAVRRRSLLGRTVEPRPCPFLDDLPRELLADRQQAARTRRPRQLSLL
jgi:superfamily I DNA/RNA helicase